MESLGRVGLWTGVLEARSAAAAAEIVAELDEQGWAALWFGEAYGREAFLAAEMVLAASRRMTVATGIANIYARDAVTMNAGALTLAERYPGRFLLGMGVSHQPLVARMRGHDYSSPYSAMRDYLAALAQAPYGAPAPAEPPRRVLAALGPKMLELSRDAADGAHPYLVTPEHTARAREILGPGKLLAVEQAAVLSSDEETYRARAHWHLEIYTGLPNYRNSWQRLGFTDDDMGRGGSHRLQDALVAHGDETAIRARVQEHLDAGADHVCVQVLGDSATDVPADDWRRLAPALLG